MSLCRCTMSGMLRPSLIALALLMASTSAIPAPVSARPITRGDVGIPRLSSAGGTPEWKRRLKRTVRGLPMSVDIRYEGKVLFRKDARNKRPPASVQKLLLSMALFNRTGNKPIETIVASRRQEGNRIPGDLWVFGRGDPSITSKRQTLRKDYPTRLSAFVNAIKSAGVRRIGGSIGASKKFFKRDWDARGWLWNYQEEEVALPTALTINGNDRKGARMLEPEMVFARKLTHRLESAGVSVAAPPKVGKPETRRFNEVATVSSAPFWVLARGMNKISNNFFAEVLGKRLGALRFGSPGTIRKGARALRAFARGHHVRLRAFDSSGLSFANRVSPRGVVSLLSYARRQSWWPALRRGLAAGNEGTLVGRLGDVRVRAKTGTLDGISALAGWVWLDRVDGWAEFSILSRGLSKDRAMQAEDQLLRIASERARP